MTLYRICRRSWGSLRVCHVQAIRKQSNCNFNTSNLGISNLEIIIFLHYYSEMLYSSSGTLCKLILECFSTTKGNSGKCGITEEGNNKTTNKYQKWKCFELCRHGTCIQWGSSATVEELWTLSTVALQPELRSAMTIRRYKYWSQLNTAEE